MHRGAFVESAHGEAGIAVAELVGRETELRLGDGPRVNVSGIEELVTATSYQSGAVVQRMKSYEVSTYIPEKQQKRRRNWQGKADKQQAAYQNRGGCEATTASVCSGDLVRWPSAARALL
jgi:hypothetical protein